MHRGDILMDHHKINIILAILFACATLIATMALVAYSACPKGSRPRDLMPFWILMSVTGMVLAILFFTKTYDLLAGIVFGVLLVVGGSTLGYFLRPAVIENMDGRSEQPSTLSEGMDKAKSSLKRKLLYWLIIALMVACSYKIGWYRGQAYDVACAAIGHGQIDLAIADSIERNNLSEASGLLKYDLDEMFKMLTADPRLIPKSLVTQSRIVAAAITSYRLKQLKNRVTTQ